VALQDVPPEYLVSGEGEREREVKVRHCNVLEWRLAGKYQFAHEERFIFSGRSCSICGWKGCNICPARQICRLNRSGGWVGGGGEEESVELRPGDIVVQYENKHVMQPWADVILFPATGDLGKFVFPSTKPETQAWVAIAGESSFWWEQVETLKEDGRFFLFFF
jgi:hypothetical protein